MRLTSDLADEPAASTPHPSSDSQRALHRGGGGTLRSDVALKARTSSSPSQLGEPPSPATASRTSSDGRDAHCPTELLGARSTSAVAIPTPQCEVARIVPARVERQTQPDPGVGQVTRRSASTRDQTRSAAASRSCASRTKGRKSSRPMATAWRSPDRAPKAHRDKLEEAGTITYLIRSRPPTDLANNPGKTAPKSTSRAVTRQEWWSYLVTVQDHLRRRVVVRLPR
jgi:hypothetical protein